VALAIDQLEQVSVHGLAEEESLEVRRAQRLDELAARLDDAPAPRGEVVDRMKERDVASELGFEGRELESFDVEHVKLLAVADVEPLRLDGGVVGDTLAPVAERLLDEARRLLDVPGGERQVREHARLAYAAPFASHLDQ
jgi:hypothetical protein